MKNKIPEYVLYIIIAVLALLLLKECTEEIEIVEVLVDIEVPIPVIEVEFDTIREPYPVYIEGEKEIDSLYYNKYLSLKDSLSRNSLFKEVITIREYNNTFEDDTLTISLYTKVQGYLQEYQVGYKTKPRTIIIDTVLKVPVPKKSEFFIGGEFGIPLYSDNIIPVVKLNAFVKTKKRLLFNVGIDTEKKVWAGLAFKPKLPQHSPRFPSNQK